MDEQLVKKYNCTAPSEAVNFLLGLASAFSKCFFSPWGGNSGIEHKNEEWDEQEQDKLGLNFLPLCAYFELPLPFIGYIVGIEKI